MAFPIIGITSNPLASYTNNGAQGMTPGLNKELIRAEITGGLFNTGYGFFSYNRAVLPNSAAWAQFVSTSKVGLYSQFERAALQITSDIPAPMT